MTTADFPDDPRPLPPTEPAACDCCGNGCEPCVYDSYAEEREHYRAALAAWRVRHPEVTD